MRNGRSTVRFWRSLVVPLRNRQSPIRKYLKGERWFLSGADKSSLAKWLSLAWRRKRIYGFRCAWGGEVKPQGGRGVKLLRDLKRSGGSNPRNLAATILRSRRKWENEGRSRKQQKVRRGRVKFFFKKTSLLSHSFFKGENYERGNGTFTITTNKSKRRLPCCCGLCISWSLWRLCSGYCLE